MASTTLPRRKSKSVIYLCLLSILICFFLAGMVFWTGQRVSDVTQNIHVKNQNLLYEQERLRVLRAEWSHLNSPQRLDRLMQKRSAIEDAQNDASRPASKGTYNTPVQGTIINDNSNDDGTNREGQYE